MVPYPAPPPGFAYVYPPGYYPPPPMGMPMPAMVTKPKRKQVKMACTNCAAACKRCDENRPCDRCQKYGIADSCVDGVRKERKKGVKRGPYKRKRKGDSDSGLDPAAAPAVPPPQAIHPVYGAPPGEGFYPVYYAPPGYVPPPEGGDVSAPAQPYYPSYPFPGYPPPPASTQSSPVTVEPSQTQSESKAQEQEPTVEKTKEKEKGERKKKKKRRVDAEGQKEKEGEPGGAKPTSNGSFAVPPPIIAVG